MTWVALIVAAVFVVSLLWLIVAVLVLGLMRAAGKDDGWRP